MRNMAVLHSPAFSYPLPVLVRVLFNLLIFKGKILYYNKYTKKGYPTSEYPFSYFLYKTNTYASATTFFTETKERFSLPLRKVTTPSTNAYNV